MISETPPYSREELKRRLRWSADHADPPVKTIAFKVGIDPAQLFWFLKDHAPLADHWMRILTDFYHKWDLGIYVLEKRLAQGYKVVTTKNPVPRKQATVNWLNGKVQFKPLPQLMGTANTWLPNALDRLEMLGSNESISVTPTGRLKATKKGARKDVTR